MYHLKLNAYIYLKSNFFCIVWVGIDSSLPLYCDRMHGHAIIEVSIFLILNSVQNSKNLYTFTCFTKD